MNMNQLKFKNLCADLFDLSPENLSERELNMLSKSVNYAKYITDQEIKRRKQNKEVTKCT
ncbi:hypothetical protein ACQV2T_04225 [Facklamia sp. P13069]|uniref:hypothetical protein n=1 Tax=Facklamia sp. P13069 TaxID=3421954 RepID=UPI003D17C728